MAIAGAIIFLGNSRGPAANGNFFTGAPNASGTGTEGTCNTCHNSGSFGEPQLAITFAEEGSTEFAELTGYMPGQTYTVQVAVGFTATAPAGYGFQSQILTDTDTPATAGMLGMPGDGVQITDGNADRRYAEHSSINNDSTWTFNWTAPAAGTGAVKLYASGNLVNRAAGTGGDNGSTSPTIIDLVEEMPTSVGNFQRLAGRVYPNPIGARTQVNVELDVPATGTYQVRITDLNGRMIQNTEVGLLAGNNTTLVGTDQLIAGSYLLSVTGAEARFVSKLIVR